MSDRKQADNGESTAKKSKRGSFTSWRGNKYPQVQLRGYYSDVVSIQNSDRTEVS